MARTSIEQKAIEKAETIGRLVGMSQSNVIGCLILLWNRSQDQGLHIVDRQWIDRIALHCVKRKSMKDAFISQLVAMRFLDDEADMTYRIKGNKKHIESLKTFKSQTKKAREMKRLKSSNRLREVEKVIHNSVEIPSDEKLWLHNWDGIDEFCREDSIKVSFNDTTFDVFEEHTEVIHSPDSKALPVADSKNKTKHEEFKKTSVNRAVDSSVNRIQLLELCTETSESENLFFKKVPREREELNGVDSSYNEISSVNSDRKISSPNSEFLKILKIWNSECGDLEKGISNEWRQKLMRERWEENPSEEFWRNIVSRISSSSFCNGKKGFRATFGWLLKPDTWASVLEGAYDDDKTPRKLSSPQSTLNMNKGSTRREEFKRAKHVENQDNQRRRDDEYRKKTNSGELMSANQALSLVMNKLKQAKR